MNSLIIFGFVATFGLVQSAGFYGPPVQQHPVRYEPQPNYPSIPRGYQNPVPFIRAPGSPCAPNEFSISPRNCANYLQCDHGRFIERFCGPGTLWNQRILACDYPNHVMCRN